MGLHPQEGPGRHLGPGRIEGLQDGDDEQRATIRLAIEQGGLAQLGPIVVAIECTGGLEYTAELARCETEAALAALDALPESLFRKALVDLAQFALNRSN